MPILKPYYQIISCFFFALLGLQIKLSLNYNDIENIVFFRSFIGSIILLIFILLSKKKIFSLFNTTNIKIHICRAIFGILAMYFGYKSLLYLSLAQASTIGFSKVFFTCLISSLVFSEKINVRIIFLIFFGFFGIFLITNPEQINSEIGLYMSVFSAICVSGGIISISYLSKKEGTLSILFYHSLISTGIFFTFFFKKINFELDYNLLNYVLLTITALIGQYFNTESYKNSQTNNIVILSYSRIIFSAIFGFIFFEEQITSINLIGILVVIISSFMVQKK